MTAVQDFGEWSIKGIFKWNNDNDVREALFYRNGSLLGKQIYKYDNSSSWSDRFIAYSESDYVVPFYRYRHSGHLLEYSRYGPHEQLLSQEEYVRDATGNELEFRRYDSEGKIVARTVRDYLAPNRLREEKSYGREGQLIRQRVIQYNSRGLAIEYKMHDYQSHREDQILSKYDESQRLIQEIRYRNDRVSFQTTYSYDDHLKTKTRIDSDAQGVTQQIETVTLDRQGNVVERLAQSPDSEPDKYIYVFDEHKRQVKEEHWQGAQLKSSHHTTFNEEGNPIQEESSYVTDLRTEQTTTVYQYDSYGNMTERASSRRVGESNNPVPGEKGVWQYSYYEDGNDSREK